MEMTLYYMPGSRAERVRWTLEELDLDYRTVPIDLFKGEGQRAEYLAIHPMGQLPALVIDGEVMIESGAIVQWLVESVPGSELAPAPDQPARRDFDQWMYFAVTSLEDPAWEMMLHGRILPEEQAVSAIVPFAEKRYTKALGVLENAVKDQDYLVDSKFSAADIMVGYILAWFPAFLTSYPGLQAYLDRLKLRPAYPHPPAE
ncbi:MAG TPA: glutathione S-transferase family protein [Gammaproteobacteria bacterium]|nr:glutathione S-transferase family protein [Gammaproteobacteria bacterium]